MELSFTVYGVAQPKGSARAFVPKGWTRAVVTSANPKNKGWQQLVAEAASHALSQSAWRLDVGPIRLTVAFYLPRPKSIPKLVVHHLKKPDLDKLTRSVKDALTRVVWNDDAQVVALDAVKWYAESGTNPRVEIVVSSVGVTE